MDALTLFGLFAVTAMLVCYALEDRSPWFILAFAASCALGSIVTGFLQGAWPFGAVEAIWAGVAVWRWRKRRPGAQFKSGRSASNPAGTENRTGRLRAVPDLGGPLNVKVVPFEIGIEVAIYGARK